MFHQKRKKMQINYKEARRDWETQQMEMNPSIILWPEGHILQGDWKKAIIWFHWGHQGPWFSRLESDPFPVEAIRSHLHKSCCFKWRCSPLHSLTLASFLACLLEGSAGVVPSMALVQLWVKWSCSECTECCWQCCKLFWGLRKNPLDINKS